MEILVAVLTSGERPDTLAQCLHQMTHVRAPEGINLRFLLVRNGISEEARVGVLAGEDFDKIEIIDEPKLGIPIARNAALRFAQDNNISWLAFVDDDAAAEQDWMIKLFGTLAENGAQAASGPQVPVFPSVTPRRFRASKVYQARSLPAGAKTSWAATNNVVFSVPFATRHRLWFNERMTAGGSDKEFFLRYTKSGGVLYWSPDAVVREAVSASRLSIGWIWRREWRKGTTEYVIQRGIYGPAKSFSICIVKSGYYLLSACRNLVLSINAERAGHVDAVADTAHAIGLLLGVLESFRPKKYS